MARDFSARQAASEFDEKVIQISRVSKKTKGGNKIGFSVLMVVGDKKGRVGVGLGKAGDVLAAIKKGVKKAKKKMIDLPLDGTTIPFAMTVKKGAGKVMLKPAPRGTGVIAGGPVRSVVEAAGVKDIVGKIMGSNNQSSSVYATFEALKKISTLVKIKDLKLRSFAQIEEEERQKEAALQAVAAAQSKERQAAVKETKAVKGVKKTAAKSVKKVTGSAEKADKAAKKAAPVKKTAIKTTEKAAVANKTKPTK